MIEAPGAGAPTVRRVNGSKAMRPEAEIIPSTPASRRLGLSIVESAISKPSVFGNDRVCAVVAARSAADAVRQVKAAISASGRAHIVELRLDFLANHAEITRLLGWAARQPKIPAFIATCRRHRAGGFFRGSAAGWRASIERRPRPGKSADLHA